MASITTPYLSAKIAQQRVNPVVVTLNYIAQMSTDLAGAGLSPARVTAMMTFYKRTLLNYIQNAVTRGASEALYHSLSGAGESDNKNASLTPIIAGTPVNPIAVTNAAELVAMLADGVQAANDLQTIINNANQILS